MNGDNYALRSQHRTRGAHSNLIPPIHPGPKRPYCALGRTLCGSLAWRLLSHQGSAQCGPYIKADYNIACKCMQLEV